MKRLQNSIVMSQQEWLNVAVLAKWIPDTFLKTAQGTQAKVLQCPTCKQQFPLGPNSAMCPKCKVATVVTQPTDVVSGNFPPPPATPTMPSIANTSTGLQKTARIDNVRFANNTIALSPEEWEQIGMRTGWLEKEAGLGDWWRSRQQQKKQKQQQEVQRQKIRQQVNQNVEGIVGDVERAQGLVGRNGTIYRDSVVAFNSLKKLMADIQWLAGMDPQGQVIPKEQIQGVEQAIQLAGKQVTDIASLISTLTAEPNVPEANLNTPAAAPAKAKRPSRKVQPTPQVKEPMEAPADYAGAEAGVPALATAKTSVRLVKTAKVA